jgi:hypothetical protein
VHRAPEVNACTSEGDANHKSARAAVRRRTPALEGNRTCIRLAGRDEADVRALLRASESWRGIRITEFELRQAALLRNELNEQFAMRNAPAAQPINPASRSRISSNQPASGLDGACTLLALDSSA